MLLFLKKPLRLMLRRLAAMKYGWVICFLLIEKSVHWREESDLPRNDWSNMSVAGFKSHQLNDFSHLTARRAMSPSSNDQRLSDFLVRLFNTSDFYTSATILLHCY